MIDIKKKFEGIFPVHERNIVKEKKENELKQEIFLEQEEKVKKLFQNMPDV